MRHLLDTTDLTLSEIDALIDRAEDIVTQPDLYMDRCKGVVLATLFFEPSTRTRLSFDAAMQRLGGKVIGFSSAKESSASKGESLADTIHTVNCYADIIAMRHPLDGSAYLASLHSRVPIINAGDGGHHHPTQTLADLYTIKRHKGRLSGLTIGLCGDLKYGRTVHSLISALSRYENNRFILISPDELQVPDYVKAELSQKGIPWREVRSMEEAMGELDVLYMTRVQQERFTDGNEYLRLKDVYILTKARLLDAPKDMIIMHPLPRVNEIAVEIDSDPRACYFEQMKNGMYIRMALILMLLAERGAPDVLRGPYEVVEGMRCMNMRCVARQERGILPLFARDEFSGECQCAYCESMGRRVEYDL